MAEGMPRDGRHVIAEGSYGVLSWMIWAEPQPDGDLMSMIRVTDAEGHILHEGGGAGPAVLPGRQMSVSSGGSDDGPWCLLARVVPEVSRVVLTAADGAAIEVPVYDSPAFPAIRFAGLLLSGDHRLRSVAGLGESGEERERFDLSFHQDIWHSRRARHETTGHGPPSG